jgi:hypothetical protein
MHPQTDRMIGLFPFSKYYRVSTSFWGFGQKSLPMLGGGLTALVYLPQSTQPMTPDVF